MKTSDIARKLGVTTQSLNVWIGEFNDFFSDHARRARNRSFNESDLDVLATIAKASRENGLKYDAIRELLISGHRDQFEATTLAIDSPMVAQSTAHALVDIARVQSELEFIKAERDRLIEEMTGKDAAIKERDQRIDDRDQRIAALQKEIADLRERVGRAENEVEMRRKEDEKRRRWWGG